MVEQAKPDLYEAPGAELIYTLLDVFTAIDVYTSKHAAGF